MGMERGDGDGEMERDGESATRRIRSGDLINLLYLTTFTTTLTLS